VILSCIRVVVLTDSPLAFIKVCGMASITGTSPIRPTIHGKRK
jgi:hypothetical protein